jgi:hypothetical protein
MKSIALFFALVLFSASAAAARPSEVVVDYVDQPVATSSGIPVSAEQVKQAIADAATQRRWKLAYAPKGGLIEAALSWGKHTIVVNITYDSTVYSVVYRDSTNMNYGPYIEYDNHGNRSYTVQKPTDAKGIHPYYNRRVEELMTGIRANLRKL